MDVPLAALLETNGQISTKIANAVGFGVVDTSAAKMSAGEVSALMISNAAQSRIMRNFTRENLLINAEEQEAAIRDYPDSAWGYLGQALVLRNGLRHGWIEDDEAATRQRMNDLAHKAVALDPNNFMAHHALGRVLMYNRDVEAAIGAFRRGAQINPSSSLVLVGLADGLVFVGDTGGALEVIARIERIDPLYGFSAAWTKAWARAAPARALACLPSRPRSAGTSSRAPASIRLGSFRRSQRPFRRELPVGRAKAEDHRTKQSHRPCRVARHQLDDLVRRECLASRRFARDCGSGTGSRVDDAHLAEDLFRTDRCDPFLLAIGPCDEDVHGPRKDMVGVCARVALGEDRLPSLEQHGLHGALPTVSRDNATTPPAEIQRRPDCRGASEHAPGLWCETLTE